MNDHNPYAAPQASLQTAEPSSELPTRPLPSEFATGAQTLLLTFWNPLAIVVMNVAFAIHEALGPISALVIFAFAIRGYLPFCRAETNGKYIFRVVTLITGIFYGLFVITLFGVISNREDSFRNCLLGWLIGNSQMMVGIGLVAREYHQQRLRKWSIWACVFSLLLFASVLPLQTRWLGFQVLHTFAAWYYFVGIAFYLINIGVLAHIRQAVTDPYQSLTKKPSLPATMEIPESLRRDL